MKNRIYMLLAAALLAVGGIAVGAGRVTLKDLEAEHTKFKAALAVNDVAGAASILAAAKAGQLGKLYAGSLVGWQKQLDAARATAPAVVTRASVAVAAPVVAAGAGAPTVVRGRGGEASRAAAEGRTTLGAFNAEAYRRSKENEYSRLVSSAGTAQELEKARTDLYNIISSSEKTRTKTDTEIRLLNQDPTIEKEKALINKMEARRALGAIARKIKAAGPAEKTEEEVAREQEREEALLRTREVAAERVRQRAGAAGAGEQAGATEEEVRAATLSVENPEWQAAAAAEPE